MKGKLFSLAVIAFVLLGIHPRNAFSIEQVKVGKELPKFSLKMIDGKTFKSFEFVGKKPMVINFWATW